MGDRLVIVNLVSLLVILLVNLLMMFTFGKYGNVSAEESSKIRMAHLFWTANWLLWLFSWFAYSKNLVLATIILNDAGAFCLIACAIALSTGLDAVKKYALPICSFLVLDCIYMLAFNVLVHDASGVSNESSVDFLSNSPQVISDVIQHHTVLFGPSLCLTMLALGLVALTFARRFVQFELGIVFGTVGVVYAFAQIPVYQSSFFIPFLKLSDGAKLFLISWRILFVAGYWLAMLAAAGIAVAGTRIWGAVSTAIAMIGSIVGVYTTLKKH